MNIVCLGTASCFPSPSRGVSCTGLRFEDGITWLFDCGEGSQIQLQRSVLKTSKIKKIFITHLHGDHLFGLPGLMCTIGSQCPDRSDFILEIYGPHGLRRYLRESLSLARSPLPYNYVVHELMPIAEQFPEDWTSWIVNHESDLVLHPQEIMGKNLTGENDVWDLFSDEKCTVRAGPILHRIPCFGFVVEEKDKPGALNVNEMKRLGVPPGPLYGRIKQGETVTLENGIIIKPSDVLGSPKRGKKVTILGDTNDPSRLSSLAKCSDVLFHEATMENALREKAVSFGHSTPSMAAQFAQRIRAKKLILSHFSQKFRENSTEDDEEVPCVDMLRREALQEFEDDESCEVILADDLLVIPV